MKLFFSALWCFCFILIAVIGCDQKMNMMKPVVQDVMDAKPEDKPDTTVPVSQPDAEVEQGEAAMKPTVPEPDRVEDMAEAPNDLSPHPDAEVGQGETTMDPTVPEPNVEAPPVLVEDLGRSSNAVGLESVEIPPGVLEGLSVELSDQVGETPEEPDTPYIPLAGLTVSDGRVRFLLTSAGACIGFNTTVNGVSYNAHSSKWQRRGDSASPWSDIQGTESDEGLCPYAPTAPGQYRLVCEISVDGVRGRYASENILTVE